MHCWWKILIGIVLALFVCIIYIMILRWIAGPMVWLSIFGALALLAAGKGNIYSYWTRILWLKGTSDYLSLYHYLSFLYTTIYGYSALAGQYEPVFGNIYLCTRAVKKLRTIYTMNIYEINSNQWCSIDFFTHIDFIQIWCKLSTYSAFRCGDILNMWEFSNYRSFYKK